MKKIENILFLLISPLMWLLLALHSHNAVGFEYTVTSLFKGVFLAIIHFSIIVYLLNKEEIKRITAVIASIMFVTVVVLESVIQFLIVDTGRLHWFYLFSDIIWIVICGFVIFGNNAILKSKHDTTFAKTFIGIEAVLALIISTLAPHVLAATVGAKYAIDLPQVLYFPGSMAFLAMISFFLGRMLTKQLVLAKLVAWLIAILVSVGACMGWLVELEGLFSPLGSKIWLITTAFVFFWSLVGGLIQNKFIQKARSEIA